MVLAYARCPHFEDNTITGTMDVAKLGPPSEKTKVK